MRPARPDAPAVAPGNPDESARLHCLAGYGIMDTDPHPAFDRLTALASDLFDAPIALVSLIDEARQWFKSRVGLDAVSTPRSQAFCAHVIPLGPGGLLVVEDATKDARFSDNPLVLGAPHIRFYAGAALTTPDGHVLGTLCVIDTRPRPRPTDRQLARLRALAEVVVGELEHHRAALADRERRAMLEMAEQMSGVGHWRYQLRSGRIEWSAEVYRICGVSPDQFAPDAESVLALYHPQEREDVATFLAAVQDPAVQEREQRFRLVRPDGSTRLLTCRARCERDSLGRPTSVFGISQDITEFMEAAARAEAAANAKTDFLANMSHEFRTPLTSIIGFTRLSLQDSALGGSARRWIEKVDAAGQSLLTLVNDVLDLARLEAGGVAIARSATDVAALCRASLELVAPQAAQKSLELKLAIAGAPPAAMLDAQRLRQVIGHLLANALKFTPAGAVELEVAYERAEGLLRVAVADTGPGISAADQQRLFQRFSQLDAGAARAHGGVGLGLAICKSLVEAMGGRIGVESTFGVGSRFWFEIPAEPAATVTDGLRVLLVESRETGRAEARRVLEACGAAVTEAASEGEALALAESAAFELVLISHRVAGGTAEHFLRSVRETDGLNDQTPVVAMVPAAEASHPARGAGFFGHLRLPLDPDGVRAILDEVAAPRRDRIATQAA